MIAEHIKKLLGEDLAGQVDEALKGKGKDGKDVDLVCGNDGSFVPNDKYDGEKRRAASAEEALKAAADAVKVLGGSGDPAKLAQDAATAKATIDRLDAEHKAEIQKVRKDTALRLALGGSVHDPADVIGRLDLEKVSLKEDGSLETELAPLLDPIRQMKPYLFREDKPPEQPPLKGAQPAPVGGQPPRQYTVEELGKLSMEEYAAYRGQQK